MLRIEFGDECQNEQYNVKSWVAVTTWLRGGNRFQRITNDQGTTIEWAYEKSNSAEYTSP